MKISTIDVTAERPYQVVVGTGALDYLPQYLADVKRIAVIHPPVLREAAARIGEGCDAEVLRRIRRRSLAAARRDVEPVEPAAKLRTSVSWLPGCAFVTTRMA